MSISTTVKSIQDIMRQDAGVDGDAQRISQLAWMLFLKIFDDREAEYEINPGYQSPMPQELRWRSWAADDEGITGGELLRFIDTELFPGLSDPDVMLNGSGRGKIVFDIFNDSYNYMKSGTLIRQVVNKINEIDFTASQDRHIFNDIYEKILLDLQSAGNAGEYYTPRAVTQFMVEMSDPQLGDVLLDPACGTGGFLVNAVEHIRGNYIKSDEGEAVLETSMRGIEKKPLPHMLAMTNLILHDIEIPLIEHDNALTRRPLRDYGKRDQVNVIVTNPPFGGTEEPGVEQNFPSRYRTKETADLFLALIIKLLKDKGGRGALVLPDGSLFGEGVKTRLKERLMDTCNLHTIVRLPNGVFNPYTGIRTNLLFFTKGEPTTEVWYFEHPLPPDRKNYSKTRPIDIKEFDLEKAWWVNREENQYAWKVTIDEIRARNYNLDIKNPYREEEQNGDPEELLAKYQQYLVQLQEMRQALKDELEEALG
jgi:type I restriction enzyme M protein